MYYIYERRVLKILMENMKDAKTTVRNEILVEFLNNLDKPIYHI